MTLQRFTIHGPSADHWYWPITPLLILLLLLIPTLFLVALHVDPSTLRFSTDQHGTTPNAILAFDLGSIAPATEQTVATLLARQLPQTSHIALAQLIDTQSAWNQTHTMIVTKHRLALLQPLLGTLASEIVVETEGGFLPEESIGLWVAHGATLPAATPLLLFLSAEGQHYRVSGDEQGVFTVAAGQVMNNHLNIALSIDAFIDLLTLEMKQAGTPVTLLATTLRAAAEQLLAVENVASGTIVIDDPTGATILDDEQPRWVVASVELAINVNLNSTQIDGDEQPRGDFYQSIARALRTWSVVTDADFTLLYAGETDATETGYNGKNEIVFIGQGRNRPLGQAQIWYTAGNVILEVDMWINDDYDLNVGDHEPAFEEIDLESVVLHELGHWVPLAHDSNAEAVMYSVLAPAQTKRNLSTYDIENLVALYPCALPPCINATYQGEMATPTPESPTITPTPTIISTLIPTTVPTAYNIYLPLVVK